MLLQTIYWPFNVLFACPACKALVLLWPLLIFSLSNPQTQIDHYYGMVSGQVKDIVGK